MSCPPAQLPPHPPVIKVQLFHSSSTLHLDQPTFLIPTFVQLLHIYPFSNVTMERITKKNSKSTFLIPTFVSLLHIKLFCNVTKESVNKSWKCDDPLSTVVKLMIDLWCHAPQMFRMILSSVTRTFQNMLVLKISNKGFMVNQHSKIPHTGDTESLDRCGS